MWDAGACALQIISVDESIFHQRQVVKKAWSTVYSNLRPQSLRNREPCIAVVGAMSRELGWIHHLKRHKSIKGEDMLTFLKELRAKVTGECALLLDNASIHKTKYIRDYCAQNRFRLLFLPPYQPQFQPIELTWALIKAAFKKLILSNMCTGACVVDLGKLVDESCEGLS